MIKAIVPTFPFVMYWPNQQCAQKASKIAIEEVLITTNLWIFCCLRRAYDFRKVRVMCITPRFFWNNNFSCYGSKHQSQTVTADWPRMLYHVEWSVYHRPPRCEAYSVQLAQIVCYRYLYFSSALWSKIAIQTISDAQIPELLLSWGNFWPNNRFTNNVLNQKTNANLGTTPLVSPKSATSKSEGVISERCSAKTLTDCEIIALVMNEAYYAMEMHESTDCYA